MDHAHDRAMFRIFGCSSSADITVATKPLLGDSGLSVPQRPILRRCVMNDTLRDCSG